MKRAIVKIHNPALRFAAGFGMLFGAITLCAAVIEGVLYGVGYLVRYLIYTFVFTDRSSEALGEFSHIWGIFGLDRVYEGFGEHVGSLEPLCHIGYNNLIGALAIGALLVAVALVVILVLMIDSTIKASHGLGEKYFDP